MEQNASFGFWLTRRRQSMRIQRTDLAARIGCAAVTLRKIEADERRPSRQIAERMAVELALPQQQHELFIKVARGELPVDRLEPAQPSTEVLSNLPRPTTALIGRQREVAEVQALLGSTEVRLLTLTGAPGVGKSRLALEAALGVQSAFADGTFLVALGPLHDPKLVLTTIAQALQIGAADNHGLIERIGRFLRKRQILIVLDTFEHVLAAAPQLSQLLAAAPQLKLLITSRVALELSSEQRFMVLPLLAPPADYQKSALTAVEAQARYPAVEMFVRRAQALAPNFSLSNATASIVGEICRRLDGLPLAIELTAARASLFTPAELLTQLDDRFALLTSRSRDLPERHLSLRYAIGWSYSLLSPSEQQLFRRLSVFVGGCTIEAIQAVCTDGRDHGPPIVDQIAALVASSLLQRYEGSDGRSRFGMLETVRAYAQDQLLASAESEALRDRHAAYYLALAEAAERAWDRAEEWAILQRLVATRDNLRAALQRLIDTGDATAALRLNSSLLTFWTTCSALSEARSWIEAALALPRPASTPALDRALAKVLNVAGYVAAGLGDYGQALDLFERGQTQYQALGDDRGSAWSIRGRAFVYGLRNEGGAAEQLLNQSLHLCQACGDSWGVAWSLYALANARLIQHDLAQAQAALQQALTHLRQQDMTFGVVRTLFVLGHAHYSQGALTMAESCYREGLALLHQAPLLTLLATGLEGLAVTLAAQGHPMRAARLFGAAEALNEATGARRGQLYQPAYDQTLAEAPRGTAWATAWGAGRALTPAQALAEALETDDLAGDD